MKKINRGKSTKNQANPSAPAPQIRFKIQVQSNIYNIFITKITATFDTSHEYEPKQYICRLPKFCENITINAITEITK